MAMFISGWVNVDNRIICCRNVLCMLQSHFTSFYILPIIYNTDLLLDCSLLYIIRSLLTNIAFLYVLSTVGPMMQRFQSFTSTLSFTDAVIVTDIVFMDMKKKHFMLYFRHLIRGSIGSLKSAAPNSILIGLAIFAMLICATNTYTDHAALRHAFKHRLLALWPKNNT